jgi:hypothetical protein
MKISHVWKSGSAKKKTRPTYKINWEVLGLSRPDQTQSLSMDTIRNQVSLLATQGLSERTQSPSAAQPLNGRGHKRRVNGSPVRRRGATE